MNRTSTPNYPTFPRRSEPVAKRTETKTAATKQPKPQSTPAELIEQAAARGVAEFAGHFTRFRSLAPGIASKRTSSTIYAAAIAMVDELRGAVVGAFGGGKVDIDAACELAEKAIEVAVKAFDAKGIPSPFVSLIATEALQRLTIPVLRVALETWNDQVTVPPKHAENL